MTESPKLGRSVCPYLCSIRDEKTFYTYPTVNNRCGLGITLPEISYEHQAYFCLGQAHQECPLYKDPLLAEKASFIDAVPPSVTEENSVVAGLYDRSVEIDRGRPRAFLWLLALGGAIAFLFLLWFISQDGSSEEIIFPIQGSFSPTLSPSWTVVPSQTPTHRPPSPTNTASPTATFTATSSATPSYTYTATLAPSATTGQVSITASATLTETYTSTPRPSATFTVTATPSYTLTLTATTTFTATSSATLTTTPIPTVTLTFTSTATFTASATPTYTLTPTSSYTPTLVPPATTTPALGQSESPQPYSEEAVYDLLLNIAENYGIEFAYPLEWQPTTVQEVILFSDYLAVINHAFQQCAAYLHYFSRAPQDVTPEQFFRQHFDRANIRIDRVTEDLGIYGTRLLLSGDPEEPGYMLQVAPSAMTDPFPIVRELGHILNDLLNNAPVEDFQARLGGSQQGDIWEPGMGYSGYETLFPGATVNVTEDYEDTFGRMLIGELSLDVANERYQFMLDYLSLWLADLRNLPN
jgi:hypothetical protein